jgi:YHS domain-containing protein
LLENFQERRLATAASSPSEAASSVKLQADWATAFYPESMAGGQLQLIGQAEAPASGEEVRLASYSDAPPAEPPPVLDGYCPVQLRDHERWVRGDPRYKVTYRGQTLLLSGAAERQRFLASPERYAPASGGNDPVLEMEQGRHVPGKPEHSAVYNQRLHLFASAATLAKFRDNPQRYASREP